MASTELDYNSNWRTHSTKRMNPVQLYQYCPERPYIELRIPEFIKGKEVKRVVFTIASHDQGWADANDSFTWSEACVQSHAGGNSPRRRIQTNHGANDTFNTYGATWDYQDSDPRIANLVHSLQPGDIIQLFPRAYYPGWVNFIKEAMIEIAFEDTKEPDSTQPGSRLLHPILPDYKTLDRSSREIRLLVIHSGSLNDPITCSLVHSSLIDTQRVPFEALSYCWGDERDSTIIYLTEDAEQNEKTSDKSSKREIRVSRSVGAALKHLRYDNSKARVFWIDATCIDAHHTERNTSET